jgi:uncharacterized protein YjbI with pentapeptide repeats
LGGRKPVKLEPPLQSEGAAAPTDNLAASPPPETQGPAAVVSGSELPDFAKKADDLEAIKTAVDDAASVGGGLWLSYLFVLFYLAVAAGAVTHADLFLENPVKLPFLNIELPLLAFFVLAPILFVVVHAYALVHLVMLSDKAKTFHRVLHEQIGDKDTVPKESAAGRAAIRAGLQRQLPSNIFVQFLAGPPDIRASLFGSLLRGIAWSTLVVAPVLLLLLMQIQFLPFHSSFITWTHRVALLVDLALIWWLWRVILAGRAADSRRRPVSLIWTSFGLALSASVVLFSVAAATFVGEWQTQRLAAWRPIHVLDQNRNPITVSIHDWLFESGIDRTTRHRRWPLSSTLVLTGFSIYEGLKIDDSDKLKGRDFVFRARGRDLKGAIFDLASLPKVDFTGADLQGASLEGAQFQGSSLESAHLEDAALRGARLAGVSLDFAQLQGAHFDAAQLQGASFDTAELQGASLDGADLQGADFSTAQLQGASLDRAKLQGVSFEDARLQGASLLGSQLQGADLRYADLRGVSLENAALLGASLYSAQLQGALLSGSQLQGASLEGASLTATDLSQAFFWRTKGVLLTVTAVKLWHPPDAWGPGRDQWEPLWRDPRFKDPQAWNQDAYQDLRRMTETLPKGDVRDDALDRIQTLDPSISPPPEVAVWRNSLEGARVDDAAYVKALAAELKTLVCSGREDALYVLRGLLRHAFEEIGSPLRAAGPEAPALTDFLMSKDCPVAAMLTDADRAKLLDIKESESLRH